MKDRKINIIKELKIYGMMLGFLCIVATFMGIRIALLTGFNLTPVVFLFGVLYLVKVQQAMFIALQQIPKPKITRRKTKNGK